MKNTLIILSMIMTSISINAQWVLVWNDEFDAPTLDITKWTNDVGGNGWGNNEAQYYTNGSNLSFANGLATITAKQEQFSSNQYTSAKIISKNLFDIKYGKIEGRMKCPMGQGLWPAFWMLGSNIDAVSWPQCGEIDIMEHINNETKIHGTAHWNNVSHQYLGGIINNDPTAFHTYSITWDSLAIKWYMDDQLYYLLNIQNNVNGTEEFHEKFYLLLNLAVGGDWPGYPINTTVFPAEFVIDYVRVYKDQSELSTSELQKDFVTVYPNPTEDYLTIAGENILEYSELKLYSASGTYLFSPVLNNNKIDISSIQTGVYFLEFVSDKGLPIRISFTKK
jgi:beta-glucanase (GH16 family)